MYLSKAWKCKRADRFQTGAAACTLTLHRLLTIAHRCKGGLKAQSKTPRIESVPGKGGKCNSYA